MHPTLTVFRASAGSGKTFTLAVEYIKLLIENPEAYRSILAVTFTNKATEEMKMRILSQLYGLSHRLKDSRRYAFALMEKLSGKKLDAISEEERQMHGSVIAERSGKALQLLLDNYHFFRVQTIDTFFQSVLRNLARELQLNANLRVELNDTQVVDEAVDSLIDSIADNAPLRNVVMSYIRERLKNNESWNFIRGIKKFGSNIFRDFYKEHRDLIDKNCSAPDFFPKYKEKLNLLCLGIEKKYHDIGDRAMQAISDNGLSIEDFNYGKSGAIAYFIKIAGGKFTDIDIEAPRMRNALNDPASWVKKTSDNRDAVASLVNSTLHPLMVDTESQRSLDVRQYVSARKTLERIDYIWLLKHVEEYAKEVNESSQRFMLSDTPTLLNKMVADDDSPFIFEKIGAHLEHIMIDEFQDTSTVQWSNFKKLLLECMSKGGSNLLVGDVKQSIYRWRSGDWRLLNDINREFPGTPLQFKPLDTNYRSDRNIINFNNTFFKTAANIEIDSIQADSKQMATQLRNAYGDVRQLIPDSKATAGFVHIDLMPKDSDVTMEERVLDIISTLLGKGARQRDIALLLRGNKEAVTLAAYLEDKGINVVSAEAFRLDASAAVRTIVGAMKYLARPNETLTRKLLTKDSSTAELPPALTEHRDSLLTLSLHDMAEEIVRIFRLGNLEGAYISTFFDKLHDFCANTSTVLEDFLGAWDDEYCSQTIETPDCDGVRILTIHKSKGLEFKHVIIPYCNWKLELPSTLWCEPGESPFDELPIVPLNYTSVTTFKNTIYAKDIVEEHVQNMVDNLNLLYVAFTRAGSSLFVIGTRDAKPTHRSCIMEQVVKQLPDNIEAVPLHVSIPEGEDEDISLTYGSIDSIFQADAEDEERSKNVFLPEIVPIHVDVTSYCNNAVFMQSNDSRLFADDALDQSDRQRFIRMGTVMHQIFSQIATTDDILPILQRMEFDGTLYGEGITKEILIGELRKRFLNPQVREWFSDKWTLYNECSILDNKGPQRRPDRVMTDGRETIVVDFKFGSPDADHHKQVSKYMELLREMGMPGVKGYLWYVTMDKIETV
mgnify:CR=1 FL=1